MVYFLLDFAQATLGKDTLGRTIDVTLPLFNLNCAEVQYTDLCIDISDFLNRTAFPSAAVYGGYDATICALTKFLDHSILDIDHKSRVQG